MHACFLPSFCVALPCPSLRGLGLAVPEPLAPPSMQGCLAGRAPLEPWTTPTPFPPNRPGPLRGLRAGRRSQARGPCVCQVAAQARHSEEVSGTGIISGLPSPAGGQHWPPCHSHLPMTTQRSEAQSVTWQGAKLCLPDCLCHPVPSLLLCVTLVPRGSFGVHGRASRSEEARAQERQMDGQASGGLGGDGKGYLQPPQGQCAGTGTHRTHGPKPPSLQGRVGLEGLWLSLSPPQDPSPGQ